MMSGLVMVWILNVPRPTSEDGHQLILLGEGRAFKTGMRNLSEHSLVTTPAAACVPQVCQNCFRGGTYGRPPGMPLRGCWDLGPFPSLCFQASMRRTAASAMLFQRDAAPYHRPQNSSADLRWRFLSPKDTSSGGGVSSSYVVQASVQLMIFLSQTLSPEIIGMLLLYGSYLSFLFLLYLRKIKPMVLYH